MLLWTYMYILICVQELDRIFKLVWLKFQPGDCSYVISLFLIFGQTPVWVFLYFKSNPKW